MTKKQLFKLLERQIEISRFEAHVRRDLLKRLNKLHRQVKGRIGEEDLDNIGKRDLNKLIKDIGELSAVAHAELVDKVNEYSFDLIEDETDFIYKEYGEAWGVPDKRPPVVLPTVLGATISEWLSKQATDYAHSVKMAVRNNDTIDHLPRQLGHKTKTFAVTWASSTSQQRLEQVAEKSTNTKGWWHVSTLDGRTSDICLVRSNKRWDKDKKPIGHDLQWKMNPLHPHCRSKVVPITNVSEEPAGITVEEWLDSMSDKEQAETLGVGKAAMYRRGDITLRDLLDQSGRPKTLKAIKNDWFANNSHAKLHVIKGVERDEKEIARLLGNATDPKSISEVNAAVDYQRLKGVTLTSEPIRYDETKQAIKGADFKIAESGKTVDVMYAISSFEDNRIKAINRHIGNADNWTGQIETIKNHFAKADIVLMDFRGLTTKNKNNIMDYVVSLPKELQLRIEIIEGD